MERCEEQGTDSCGVNTLAGIKRILELDVPESEVRTPILASLEQLLNPFVPLEGDNEIAERWIELQDSSPAQDLYEKELADIWRKIGCRADGAPFVIARLTEIMNGGSLFAWNSVEVPRLATDFLAQECAGARGMSPRTRAQLTQLRSRSSQPSAKP
jgi:hypothetical protein